jgi:SAM-dependent methyltransferase
MAPEVALETLDKLEKNSLVLDPMAGSGTVLRDATELGHRAIGFDVDPLAVLMARVWTTPVSDNLIDDLGREVVRKARALKPKNIVLPWIDKDEQNSRFVSYWFGEEQRNELRRLALILSRLTLNETEIRRRNAVDVLRIALSRIIVTKDRGASLARDVSHSRPHKVDEDSDFAVIPAFESSLSVVRQRLLDAPPPGRAVVSIGDARALPRVRKGSVHAVVTSPPYLNAIDYLRGHRLFLIWFGYSLSELRDIRSDSIGAERALSTGDARAPAAIRKALGNIDYLPTRSAGIIDRYARDLFSIMKEVARVLRREGRATFVVGNSCLKNVFIRNSHGVIRAGELCGLRLLKEYERELPPQHRYLPPPEQGRLGKRMRSETILTFSRA